jgi:hypothetical protein
MTQPDNPAQSDDQTQWPNWTVPDGPTQPNPMTQPNWTHNKRTQWLEIINLYPEADFNDAWYPFTNQVRCAGSIPTG